jgi:hypothetical protein
MSRLTSELIVTHEGQVLKYSENHYSISVHIMTRFADAIEYIRSSGNERERRRHRSG